MPLGGQVGSVDIYVCEYDMRYEKKVTLELENDTVGVSSKTIRQIQISNLKVEGWRSTFLKILLMQ